MEYDIKISDTCLEEIEDICEYIENKLKAELASKRLREKIKEKILELKTYPKKYVKIEKRDRLNREYRKIVIENYVLLYTIIDEDNAILISHMYYEGRNYIDGLL